MLMLQLSNSIHPNMYHLSQLNWDMSSTYVCIFLLLLSEIAFKTLTGRKQKEAHQEYIFHQLIMLIQCQMKQTTGEHLHNI